MNRINEISEAKLDSESLTDKQREVLELLSNGRTTKEIAHALGISPSAVNQRIEPLRLRLGGITRAELARRFRDSCEEAPVSENYGKTATSDTCKNFTGQKNHLPGSGGMREQLAQDETHSVLEFSDALDFRIDAPWQTRTEPRIVPEALDGMGAGVNRGLAIVALAFGLVVIALVTMSVARELTELI